MNPSICAMDGLWDASHAMDKPENPLQRLVRLTLEQAPRARDHYDKQIQAMAGTKGKPLYDLQRGRGLNPRTPMLKAMASTLGQPYDLFRRAADGELVDPAITAESRVPASTVVRGEVPDHQPTRSVDEGAVDITALDLSVSMGPGTLIDGFIESEPVKVDINVLRRLTRAPFEMLRVIKGQGDSMEPTLRTNDRVLIDTSERTMSRLHGVYWIDYEGAHGLKRLRPAGKGRIKIISDNEDAGDTFEVDADEIRIYGRAIMFWRDL